MPRLFRKENITLTAQELTKALLKSKNILNLATPLDRYKYMKMLIKLIPEEFMIAYNLYDKAKEGFIYMEVIREMYGLTQAGILANKLLKNVYTNMDFTK
mmetsp:Transcript_39274/g.76701  ORF Transcript_39274/g.76701 Transcript_39274/m.76701 type:complete len:100 (-) Transcript_39274:784-1083(-)